MRVAIIDDEEDARYLLRTAIEKEFNEFVHFIVEVDGVESATQLLNREEIDVIFLDIKMNDGTGFDLLERFPNLKSKIVFVTAYNNFALRAFEFFAFAYIVKPFKKSMLTEVMYRIINSKRNAAHNEIVAMAESYQNGKLHKIVVPELEGFRIISLDDVLYLQSDNNYSEFHLLDASNLVSSKTLKDYERLLEPEGFYRVHKSFLINLSHVEAYIKVDGGRVIMKDKTEVPIGRRKLAEFRKRFLG
ncbi:MAG: response regulator transcription factor [Saprospiraceae bacterium]|nr:LytTR family DNA-binding domain-containing protein [Bacteroidia bacterium]NNE16527.1 response regulator transcription factor [Saprospiraceae bacterium]NNL92554.1 response regulator transcription factor [Saprospiraceae bacterium]